jgi:hypothetical protein
MEDEPKLTWPELNNGVGGAAVGIVSSSATHSSVAPAAHPLHAHHCSAVCGTTILCHSPSFC